MDETTTHEKFMKRCFELARLAQNKVKSNPKVGSVLVWNNQIISEGYYQKYGGLHAERNAILDLKVNDKNKLPEATLYVSLEPCQIFGKTPPCTDIILSSGIKKVVISVEDPNPLIAGKSIELLKSKGIEVVSGILESEGQDLIKPFVANLKKRPFVLLKFAQSSDAYFGKRGQQYWISSTESQLLVHQWRSCIDGILVGHQTALIDNPRLTTRLVKGESPLRVILDDDLSIPRTHHVWSDEYPSIFITQKKSEAISEINYENVFGEEKKLIVYVEKSTTYEEDILSFLNNIGICRLMLEGGASTIKKFVAKNLWDEARIIRSNKAMVSGIRAPYVIGRLYRKEKISTDTIEYVYKAK